VTDEERTIDEFMALRTPNDEHRPEGSAFVAGASGCEDEVAVFNQAARPRLAAFQGIPYCTWMVGVCGMVGQEIPNHREELLEFAGSLIPLSALAAAVQATPLADVSRNHMSSNRCPSFVYRVAKTRRRNPRFLTTGADM
jgi:hypothetical protein